MQSLSQIYCSSGSSRCCFESIFVIRLMRSTKSGITLRLGQAEMAEGVGRQHPPARRALHEALLDQVGLDDVLDRIAGLGERRRERLDPDRPAAEGGGDQAEIL